MSKIETRLTSPLLLARVLAGHYGSLPQVEAVALGGSHASNTADPDSDIDLYVYSRADIPVSERARVTAGASRVELDNRFWEPGDEWIDAETGIHVDVMFRTVAWIEEQLDRVLRQRIGSVGYSTCFWHNVVSSWVLYDRSGWFQALQQNARQPYPDELVHAIVAKNHPLFLRSLSSYRYQINRAATRGDLVSVNHRVAALLASYFDILFAINHVLHPGEKRLVEIAMQQCNKVPKHMEQQVDALLQAASRTGTEVVERAEALIEGLNALLAAEGLHPRDEQTRPPGSVTTEV
jgi:predicted nucleotidyltransferase